MQPQPKRPIPAEDEETRAVKQRTGGVTESPITTLVWDLLGYIFSFFHPQPRLFVVSVVCKLWRRAVLASMKAPPFKVSRDEQRARSLFPPLLLPMERDTLKIATGCRTPDYEDVYSLPAVCYPRLTGLVSRSCNLDHFESLVSCNSTLRYIEAQSSFDSPEDEETPFPIVDLSAYNLPDLCSLTLMHPEEWVLSPLVRRLPALRLRLGGAPSHYDTCSIAVAAAVSSLVLRFPDDYAAAEHFLANCTNLNSLTLVPDGAADLLYSCTRIRAFTNLASLTLVCCHPDPTMEASIATLPHLTELYIDHFDVTLHCSIRHLVTRVSVKCSSKAFIASGIYPRLRKLDWTATEPLTAAAVEVILGYTPNLRKLLVSRLEKREETIGEAELLAVFRVAASAGVEKMKVDCRLNVCAHRAQARLRLLVPWLRLGLSVRRALVDLLERRDA